MISGKNMEDGNDVYLLLKSDIFTKHQFWFLQVNLLTLNLLIVIDDVGEVKNFMFLCYAEYQTIVYKENVSDVRGIFGNRDTMNLIIILSIPDHIIITHNK